MVVASVPTRGETLPRVIVTADDPEGTATHTEWVSPADFETEHFRHQLAERLAWAVSDASEAGPPHAPAPPAARSAPEPEVAALEPRRWPVAAL
jgi:hypothetical protein